MEYFTRLVVSAERRFFVMKTRPILESYRIVMQMSYYPYTEAAY